MLQLATTMLTAIFVAIMVPAHGQDFSATCTDKRGTQFIAHDNPDLGEQGWKEVQFSSRWQFEVTGTRATLDGKPIEIAIRLRDFVTLVDRMTGTAGISLWSYAFNLPLQTAAATNIRAWELLGNNVVSAAAVELTCDIKRR